MTAALGVSLVLGSLWAAVGVPGGVSGAAEHASSSPAAPLALVVNHGAPDGAGASITAIDTASHQVVATLLPGLEFDSVAVAPDSNTAYVSVVNYGPTHGDFLIPIDLGGPVPVAGNPIGLDPGCLGPSALTVSPDGSFILVGCPEGIMVVSLTTDPPTPGAVIHGYGLSFPQSIAIAPDERTAYAVFSADQGLLGAGSHRTTGLQAGSGPNSGVTPIDLTSNPPVAGTPVAAGSEAVDMAITPDGSTGYLSDIAASTIIPLALGTNPITVETPISSPNFDHPLGIALTPDAASLYAVNNPGNSAVAVDLAEKSKPVGPPIPVGQAPLFSAVTPDGSEALVTNQVSSAPDRHGTVSVIDTVTNTVVDTIPTGSLTTVIAVQPDQAPVANLSVVTAPAGRPTFFDASASTVRFGSIISYDWNFGDGTRLSTSSPQVSHVYAQSGNYSTSVVETDSAGTSITPIYTGRAMVQNGGPSAATGQPVDVPAPCAGSCGTVGIAAMPDGQGYWEVAASGGVYAFGSANYFGSMGAQHLNAPVVGIAATPDGRGYWEVGGDGGIFAFGDAGYYGSMGGRPLNAPVVGVASAPDGKGYWEVAADGGIFAFGSAGFFGSMGGRALNAPVVGLAATPDGQGYWEVAADGGIFAFGTGGFFGSMGGRALNAPVVGIATTRDGQGYWETATDGGIFAFGDAGFFGSMGGRALNAPVSGLAGVPDGRGYWEVAGDGGVFAFGSAGFFGARAAVHP